MAPWTKRKIVSLLSISAEEEYQECRAFLKDVLAERGLLGENFKWKASIERLNHSLTENFQTADHSKVPKAILDASASSDGMKALAEFSMHINAAFCNTRLQRQARLNQSRDPDLQASLSLPSVQAPHQKPLPEDCTLHLFNLAYEGQDTVTTVTQVLKDGASRPITYQDLDLCRWKSILREECGFDESLHALACSLLVPPSLSPCHVVLQGECSWQNAILEMMKAGKTYCVFWMERKNFPEMTDDGFTRDAYFI
jgi:hypothetical protein